MADFRREYQVHPDEFAAMSLPDFQLYLAGLSQRSRFTQAWADTPKHVYDPDELAAIKAAARR